MSLRLPERSSRVSLGSHALDGLLQHSGPALVTCSYTLTWCPATLHCALSGQHRVLLTRRWLVWQLSGRTGDRYRSSNRGTC